MEQYQSWQLSPLTIKVLSGGTDKRLHYYIKRCLDVSLAFLLLIPLAPVMLAVAILIKLDSAGPIFYTQERVGANRRFRDGKPVWEIQNFSLIKFRSMVNNADPALHQAYIKAFAEGRAETTDEAGTTFKLANDPRVTRVGHVLRRTSLDELPQLINVLKGQMSLVGPRPVPTYEVAEYRSWHHERLAARPGITGFWQVKGRCQVSFDQMISMDIEYVRNQSLWLDIKILLLTLPAILTGRGAG